MTVVAVSASFDDLRSRHVRFLQEAARLGAVHVLLWSDAVVEAWTGRPPKFPQGERLYFVQAIRFVTRVRLLEVADERDGLPLAPGCAGIKPDVWAVDPSGDAPSRRAFCKRHGLEYGVIRDEQLTGFPVESAPADAPASPRRKQVLVTGCYDWLHSGHVRFFEEVAELGDLTVVVGHDANIALLKGPGHPQFSQDERRYMVHAVRYVKEAMISSGQGWLDAEPEIRRVKPDLYAVNEDGDKPEKRAYCERQGLRYVVFKRLPKQGLSRRQSTVLRGF